MTEISNKRYSLIQTSEARANTLAQVEAGNETWASIFKGAIMKVAKENEPFTSDDVLKKFPYLEECPEKRVMGAVFLQLRGKELSPGEYVSSTRVASHGRPKRVWRLK